MDIQSLPPTRDALIQHIHKSAYVSVLIWGRANLLNKTESHCQIELGVLALITSVHLAFI